LLERSLHESHFICKALYHKGGSLEFTTQSSSGIGGKQAKAHLLCADIKTYSCASPFKAMYLMNCERETNATFGRMSGTPVSKA